MSAKTISSITHRYSIGIYFSLLLILALRNFLIDSQLLFDLELCYT